MLEFPRWKYFLILVVLAVSALYALPNVYQKDPSVQITANRGGQIDDALKQRVSAALGAFFLLRGRIREGSFLDKHIPGEKKLDLIAYRSVCLGLLFLTLTILTGAIWAERAWGSYWSWDPKETWSLVTWIIYAVYLHLRLRRGWKGKAAAVFAVAGFICVIFTYIGVNTFLPGIHSYA